MPIRQSLLLRADPSEGARAPWLESLHRQAPALAEAEIDLLLDYLRAELAGIDDALDRTWDDRVPNLAGARAELVVEAPQLELEAFVRLLRDGQSPRVQLGLGTLLAIDDLALFACSLPMVLAPDQTAFQRGDLSKPFRPPDPLIITAASRNGRTASGTTPAASTKVWSGPPSPTPCRSTPGGFARPVCCRS